MVTGTRPHVTLYVHCLCYGLTNTVEVVPLAEFCAYSEELGGRNTKVSSTLTKYCSDYDLYLCYFLDNFTMRR
jgi:hypothetical protein